MELSLVQLFGSGASQDENVLIIKKSSLINLTSSTNNTAESLLIAILITALSNFQGTITDESNRVITSQTGDALFFDNSKAFELLEIIQWKPFVINGT